MATIRKKVREEKRDYARYMNEKNREFNLRKKKKLREVNEPIQSIVRQLSGWQRNKWARHNYPGLRHKEPHLITPFLSLERPS